MEAPVSSGWRQLSAGDTSTASLQIRGIGEWGDDAPDDVVRCANVLSVAIGLRRDYPVTLDHLAEVVDALIEGDPPSRRRVFIRSPRRRSPTVGQTSWRAVPIYSRSSRGRPHSTATAI